MARRYQLAVPKRAGITLLYPVVAPLLTITGTTNETELANIPVPPKLMGLNGQLRITTLWSWDNNGNNKTARVRLGGLLGTSYGRIVATTTASFQGLTYIANNNSESSQVGRPDTSINAPYTATSGTLLTSSIDTAPGTSVSLTGQLGNAGDRITLVSYSVEFIPGLT